ncbi:UNVERIFIED_CONTAM: hypothetical protein GTU68_031439 [Idotea baltica]|nr:hypothetical protein [Idotea baltica]
MKALVRDSYGAPSVIRLTEVDLPVPKDDEIRVRIHATTVNRTDVGVLTGLPYVFRLFIGVFKPKRRILGTDFAGEVEAVGKRVSDFKMGDRVWGLSDEGLESNAEYMCIGEEKAVARIPEGFSFEEAVACAEGAHYALNFINKVTLKKGDKVLVNGGTGAIGSASIQLLKTRGAHVTAVCGTLHLDLVKSIGADRVIDYLTEDFTEDKERYHIIADAVGKSSFPLCKHLLLDEGVYISSELGPGWQNLYLPLITKIKGSKRVIFPLPTDVRGSILQMSQLMSEGKFQAVIDRRYTMEKVADAYRYVMSGEKIGNVILKIVD